MSATLSALLQLAERQRDAAAAAARRSETQLRRLQAQREQLLAYQQDYRQRDPTLGGRSASIDMLRCHQAFMQRLQQAVEQQNLQCLAVQAQTDALCNAQLPLEQRVASVKRLLERRSESTRLAGQRVAQRQSDEAALRQPRADNPNAMPGAL